MWQELIPVEDDYFFEYEGHFIFLSDLEESNLNYCDAIYRLGFFNVIGVVFGEFETVRVFKIFRS